jgi:very-short-patch-repair endonuclease
MDKENKCESTQINEKFMEICRRLSGKDDEYAEKNKKHGKKYETYVIYAIWNRLKNYDLEPIREKNVTCKNNKNYRIDLYFPQLNIGIECDEPHHENQKEEDKERKKRIKEALPGYEEFRIKIYSRESEKEISFEEIECKIDEIVTKIKETAKNKEIKKWNPPLRATEQYFKNKKRISVKDHVIFRNQRDALRIIFAWENKGAGQIRGFFTPKTLRKGEYKKCKAWFPKLGSKHGNRWEEEKDDEFIEEAKDEKKLKKNDRIIFVGLENGEKYKFIGIFKYDRIAEKKAYWKRILEEFPIIKDN